MQRYRSELDRPEPLQSLTSLETAVHCLDNHIDVLRALAANRPTG